MPLLRRGGVNLVAGSFVLQIGSFSPASVCTHDAGCFANVAIGLSFPLALAVRQATIVEPFDATKIFFPVMEVNRDACLKPYCCQVHVSL